MTEIVLPNMQKAASSDYWSLASNQYPSGKFPKVSIGIPIPRTGSVSGSRDAAAAAAAAPAFERNPSQGTDGRSRPPKAKGHNASLRVSQEAANHGGSATEAPEAAHVRGSLSQPDDHAREQTGTFSFGTRKEQGSQLDQLQKTAFVNSQGKCQVESADKTKPNSEVLRMKLWGILGTSQTKQAVASPNLEDIETPDQPKSLTTNVPSLGIKKVYTSRFPDIIKTPDLLNCQTATYAKSKPSSDPIESDSDTPQVVEIRPVTRNLGRKKAPAASKKQDKSQSAKKPLPTSRSAPKQKKLDSVFVFDEKCTPKTVGKSANGNSGCLRNLRSSSRKAKAELKKVHCSDTISDKITQDARGQLSSRNAPSENKGEKTTSLSSLSRTGKTAESRSRSPTREKRLNGMAKVGPQKMQLSEKLLPKTLNEGEDKLSSQKISSKSKENYSSVPHRKENSNLSKASVRSPQAHKPVGNNLKSPPSGAAAASPSPEPKMYPRGNEASPQINGKPSGAASPSPEPKMYPWDNEASPQINGKPSGAASPSPEAKMYPWDNEASPQINGKLGEKFASPLADRFRDMGDHFASPTFATKVLHDDTYSPKYPKSVNRSRSSSYASDPGSEPSDGMDKTYELPKSESPNSSEERENKKQPDLSPILPTEDETAQISVPSFGKGYKSRKWLSDVDSPDKSPPLKLDRKSRDGKRAKRRLPSPVPFATSGTEETIMSEKEPVQCPDDYLTRAFDELLLVLGRFQTKIKSETRNRSSEILSATGEIIRQHLEGVEVQMQDDVDKLVNAGKSKRKRLNSTFEEQQEQLRVLHEKFKEEVNQQLLGCKNSLEELEAYHSELKGVAEKQKASHKKLLQQAESRVGTQLNDAEIKIAKVQKRARRKMNGLKHVLKELITETAD
ncbi:meiosis-specific protein PAIR3-like [Hordeum vulgare subsp. vulgare]|uniref:Meiosis-specific protein ASY3-like coiled-coil domain-containing protein n=1 Tax=Hordeum vulgare subsp. vulgare TaxID=112509 RepID=A0A8I6W907_HORVV|nr:meiosis-specific protein PAIR3-like [Hordeum vulgare subsp. vulgare]